MSPFVDPPFDGLAVGRLVGLLSFPKIAGGFTSNAPTENLLIPWSIHIQITMSWSAFAYLILLSFLIVVGCVGLNCWVCRT